MQNQNQVKPISLEQLQQLAKGTIIQIPGFDNGTISVRVKKVDITADLLSSGVLPNELATSVQKQFEQGKNQQQVENHIKNNFLKDSDGVKEMIPLIDSMCKQALVEPTWDEFQEVYPLTLPQKFAIFQWLMEEVKAMRNFRGKPQQNAGASGKRKNMGGKTQ